MEQGLTTREAEEKLQQFGKNEIQTEEKISAVGIFLSQFPTLLNGILATAGVLSIVIHDLLDGIFIFTILLVNGIVGFIQEYNAEKSLEKLKDFIVPLVLVIRDNKEIQLPTNTIVPGDIIILSEGERIPADGKLVTDSHIEIDESIVTGESLPSQKNQNDDVLAGTLVVKGRGKLLVTRTGMQTNLGKIAETLVSIETDKTPLQIRLDALGKTLSFIAIGISILLIPIGLYQGKLLFPLILLAASIAIAAIPESLPAIITIALGIGTNRMAKKHAIVRHMPAVETLGSVQIILTDKTGTLTQNAMVVKKFTMENGTKKEDMLRTCLLGNTASLLEKTDGSKKWEVVGDKTDGALLLWAKEQKEHTPLIIENGEIVDEYVFDSITKTVTTVFKQTKSAKDLNVFVRGAPESVLANCHMTAEKKDAATSAFNAYANEGLRVIGFATKTVQARMKRKDLEKDLTFLGFIGIYDPPREEAKQAIATAKRAGIQPIMVTGDNDITALAIAKEIGLIEENEEVMTGDTMQKLSDEELIKTLPKVRIFARVRPQDKLRLVNLYKKRGFVVGVTGDGVNDALALKRADVGIAMGEMGTDVAKEAADIVLTDDNFATLVKAIEEGRKIYDNILKSITYLLSGNLAELSLVFFGTLFGLPQPLLPTQILWINLVTDGLPALALAGDTKDKDLLSRQPRDPNSQILTKNRMIFIASVGFGFSFALLLLYKILLGSYSETFARTITFNTLIISHLFIALAVRKGSFFRPNRLLIITFIGTFLLQILISTVPFFQNIFHLGFN